MVTEVSVRESLSIQCQIQCHMSDIWNVMASLERVGHRRIVIYWIDDGEETFRARLNLSDVSALCREACERLLGDLRKKAGKEIDKDTEYVEGEIKLLKSMEDQGRYFSREMWKKHE